MKKVAFAIDLGNGYVKATNIVKQENKKPLVAPSILAFKKSLGTSSLGEFGQTGDKGYEVYESPLNGGVEYIWGSGITKAVNPGNYLHTYTHNNRYAQQEFKLLCTFILSELAADFTEEELQDVVLVTGLPSTEIGTESEKTYKNFLQQKHVVTRNGVQRVINVTDVRIVEQPVGTLLKVFMTEDGLMNQDLLEGTISVIDFGAGTTILDTYKNFSRLDDMSETFYEGMNDLHSRIAKELEKVHNIKGLSPSYINEGFQRGDLIADMSARKKYPFEEVAKRIIIEFVGERLTDINRVLKNRDSVDQFILTGGGVSIVKEVFVEKFGESAVEIMENSQTANLDGYYNFASQLVR